MTTIEEIKTPSKFVYLHFHCTIEGCSNVFVKCSKEVAELFMKDLHFLYEFVQINSLNGGDPEFSLTHVDITICDQIIENKDCSHNCPTCLPKNKKWCRSDTFDKHQHTKNPTLIQEGNLFYYKRTDLFKSVMLYTFFELINKLKKIADGNLIILDFDNKIINKGNINKITLECDEKTIFSIATPTFKVEEYADFTWAEPIELNDIQLLSVINKITDFLGEFNEEHNSKKLILHTE